MSAPLSDADLYRNECKERKERSRCHASMPWCALSQNYSC